MSPAATDEQLGDTSGDLAIPPEEVARAVPDTVDTTHPPLRSPIGATAERLLDALDEAPTDMPFDTVAMMGSPAR